MYNIKNKILLVDKKEIVRRKTKLSLNMCILQNIQLQYTLSTIFCQLFFDKFGNVCQMWVEKVKQKRKRECIFYEKIK